MQAEAGTKAKLWIDWAGEESEEGDILRTHPGGSCYLIETMRKRPGVGPTGLRIHFDAVRLGKGAADPEAPGVWLFSWKPRGRRPR